MTLVEGHFMIHIGWGCIARGVSGLVYIWIYWKQQHLDQLRSSSGFFQKFIKFVALVIYIAEAFLPPQVHCIVPKLPSKESANLKAHFIKNKNIVRSQKAARSTYHRLSRCPAVLTKRLSEFEFLSFVTMNFCILSQFELSLGAIWVCKFCHN